MKRLHIIFSIILVFFVAAPYSYADTMSMEDGQITMELPAGWNVITTEQYSQEAGDYFDITEDQAETYLQTAGKVFLGEKTFKNGGTNHQSSLEISYNPYSDNTGSYDEYTTEDLEDIYDDEGESIISTVFNYEDGPNASGTPKVVNGKWGPFIQIDLTDQDAETGNDKYRLYYTVKEGVIISFVLTSEGGAPTADEIKDVEAMIKSYEDTDYYYSYMGLNEDEDDTYSNEDDFGGGITAVAIIIVVAAGIFAFLKSEGQGRSASRQSRNQNQGANANRPQERPVMAEEKSPKRTIPKFQSIKADGKAVVMRSAGGSKKAKSAEESYTASLKTLLDSGLLTKEEYREMLNRHNRRR